MAIRYFIGTSGWHYEHWRSLFYPPDLARESWLDYYSQRFNAVEINNSFYRLPEKTTFGSWRDSVSPEFCFAVKASRYITHVKRLKDSLEPLKRLLDHATNLGSTLGPVLFQLPPNLHRDDERLAEFVAVLGPFARTHRFVIEFRHNSWVVSEGLQILRERNVGFCIFDMPESTSPVVASADFVYFRFHGKGMLYGGSYPDGELENWATKIKEVGHNSNTVYAFFNNDAGAYAIQNALTLRKYLNGKIV